MIRLFVAIPIPYEVKLRISGIIGEFQKKFPNFSDIKWTTKENWHLTVSFLGDQPETAIPFIEKSLQILPKNLFKISFNRFVFGPSAKMPRMIWLETNNETSRQINLIKSKLEDELIKNGVKWDRGIGPYRGHLTLARFNEMPRNIEKNVIKEFFLSFNMASLDLMRSNLLRSGPVYTKIFAIDYGS
ncbi:MAG: RNA 2',3'-cyclic phosphodiesterase [Patescibacteria group bacterium]|nr:RNA 2',3'-cyclic phosphodiesterase [Patescibacteria group bacterium]